MLNDEKIKFKDKKEANKRIRTLFEKKKIESIN